MASCIVQIVAIKRRSIFIRLKVPGRRFGVVDLVQDAPQPATTNILIKP